MSTGTALSLVKSDTNGNARADLLDRLSHELRTPLNSVIGFSGVMQKNRVGNQMPADLQMLQAIRTNGERLLDLVDDLVAISLAATTSTRASAWTCVADVADDCVRKWKTLAQERGIEMVLEVQSAGLVRVDADSLARILCKLIGNAVKFTEKGGVTVTVVRGPRADVPLSVIVSDTGIGIRADRIASVFEPFIQADSGSARAYEGAGLGLSVARSLAEASGCRLRVESTPGVGTTFTLDLLPD